jgi:DNA-binding beta-propeller fold protein YncE
VQLEITSPGGETLKVALPAEATVVRVKEEVERKLGILARDVCLFSMNEAFEEELWEETVGSLQEGEGKKVLLSMLVDENPLAGIRIAELVAERDFMLGGVTHGNKDGLVGCELNDPRGVAFVPAHPEWIVTTEFSGGQIKISNFRTGDLICNIGKYGRLKLPFVSPWGVAVTADSSFVLVVEYDNNRVQVLRLVTSTDGCSARLEFVRTIGNIADEPAADPFAEGQLTKPCGIALLRGAAGRETVLVTEQKNHRVSQFTLDGVFLRIFAGTGEFGRGDGEFVCPRGITVLGLSGEVAIADLNNDRVQIFDREGKYKRQFGTPGEADGQLEGPSAITSDVHGNVLVLDDTKRLQVFSPEGRHLCTRNDFGLGTGPAVYDHRKDIKGIAWTPGGELAIANGEAHTCLVWSRAYKLS